MSLEDHKLSLSETFFQPGDKGAEPYITELKFNDSWSLYEWRGLAYKAAGDLEMPIKMLADNNRLTLTVSTLQSDAYESLTRFMEGAPEASLERHDPDSNAAQDHEGYDYECLRGAVNGLIPR